MTDRSRSGRPPSYHSTNPSCGAPRNFYSPHPGGYANDVDRSTETTPLQTKQTYPSLALRVLVDTVIFTAIAVILFVLLARPSPLQVPDHLDDGRNDTIPHPYWEAPTVVQQCDRSGIIQCTAKLMNISTNRDRIAWCEMTPIFINHRKLEHPDTCETLGPDVYGLWFVNDERSDTVPHPYWEAPTAGQHCHRYGAREYTAKLLNIPTNCTGNRIDWCTKIPILINHVRLEHPDICETRGNDVYGRWFVSFGEYNCMPFWVHIDKEGCVGPGSGVRRYSARLSNVYPGEDWRALCSTTPARIEHILFPAPMYCVSVLRGSAGTFGIWELQDDQC